MLFPLLALALITGAAYALGKKEEPKASSDQKLLPPAAPSTPQGNVNRAAQVGKTRQDLMMAAIKHANATKDPRDYRSAAGLAQKAGKPQTAKELAKLADQAALGTAKAATKALKVATVTGDPRAYEVFAKFAERIDQHGPAQRARAAAKKLRQQRGA